MGWGKWLPQLLKVNNLGIPKTKGEQTRERIIKNSIKLIARSGFANTSFQKIADKCEISQTAVIKHFSNKESLLLAIYEYVIANNHSIVSRKTSIEDSAQVSLQKHLDGNVEWFLKFEDEAQFVILGFYYSGIDKEFKKIQKKVMEAGKERIKANILAGMREGDFSKSIDAESMAHYIHSFLLGNCIKTLFLKNTNQPIYKEYSTLNKNGIACLK